MSILFKSKAEETVKLSYLDNLQKQEYARQVAISDRLAMLADDFEDQVLNLLIKLVSSESYELLRHIVDTTDNVFKNIIEELSDVYVDDPEREFSENEQTQEAINEIYEKLKINQLMDQVNKLLNACNDVVLHPVIRNGEIQVDILTPDMLYIIPDADDSSKPSMVIVKKVIDPDLPPEARNLYYVVWTAENHYTLNADGLEVPVENNEEMENPYGVLPFVFIHRTYRHKEIWDETGHEDIYQLCLHVGVKRTLENYTNLWSNFKQTAYVGQKPPAGITIAPDTAQYTTESETSINVLDYHVDMANIDGHIQRYKASVFQNYGIDIDSTNFKEVSGRALKIRNQKLRRYRKRQIKVYRGAESELLELILLILKVEGLGDYQADLNVDYAEAETYVDDKESLENMEKEISMGIASPVDAYMARNKDIKDRKEAIKRLQELAEERDLFKDYSVNDELNKEDKEEEKEFDQG